MEAKKFEVSVLYDREGNVIAVGKCKLVSEKDYKNLLNQMELTLGAREVKDEEVEKELISLKEEIKTLKHEINVLKGEEDDEENN